jgi:hypothetical protein
MENLEGSRAGARFSEGKITLITSRSNAVQATKQEREDRKNEGLGQTKIRRITVGSQPR